MNIAVRDLLSSADQKEFDALSPEDRDRVQAEFEEAATNMLKPVGVMLGVALKVIEMVGSSGMLAQVAGLQRQYYLALLNEGFSTDQAMALASNFASILSGLKKSG